MTTKDQQFVLVVDDDADMRFALMRIIERCGYHVQVAESGDEAFGKLALKYFDYVFCDLRFPSENSGEYILENIVENYPHIKVILMSCAMDSELRAKLTSKGASYCVQKPIFAAKCKEIMSTLAEPMAKVA